MRTGSALSPVCSTVSRTGSIDRRSHRRRHPVSSGGGCRKAPTYRRQLSELRRSIRIDRFPSHRVAIRPTRQVAVFGGSILVRPAVRPIEIPFATRLPDGGRTVLSVGRGECGGRAASRPLPIARACSRPGVHGVATCPSITSSACNRFDGRRPAGRLATPMKPVVDVGFSDNLYTRKRN
jgi:hypothetical protein